MLLERPSYGEVQPLRRDEPLDAYDDDGDVVDDLEARILPKLVAWAFYFAYDWPNKAVDGSYDRLDDSFVAKTREWDYLKAVSTTPHICQGMTLTQKKLFVHSKVHFL